MLPATMCVARRVGLAIMLIVAFIFAVEALIAGSRADPDRASGLPVERQGRPQAVIWHRDPAGLPGASRRIVWCRWPVHWQQIFKVGKPQPADDAHREHTLVHVHFSPRNDE